MQNNVFNELLISILLTGTPMEMFLNEGDLQVVQLHISANKNETFYLVNEISANQFLIGKKPYFEVDDLKNYLPVKSLEDVVKFLMYMPADVFNYKGKVLRETVN